MGRNAVTVTLRLEGLALGLLCLWLYKTAFIPIDINRWWLFALLILAPDLSMLGYLAGPRIGSIAYNVMHTWVAPAVLFVVGWWGNVPLLLPLAFILGVHIGFDRALGLGLKYETGFKDTHLNIGRTA